jgi:hypothetical protein
LVPQRKSAIISDEYARGLVTLVGQYERLVLMGEDELTEYSSDARKIEKLRRKIGLSVTMAQQKEVKAALEAELPTGGIAKLVETQRQTVALPFWGIAGLGLLFGISLNQPLDYLAAIGGTAAAIAIQKWGWKLYAKRIVLDTLIDIETKISEIKPGVGG